MKFEDLTPVLQIGILQMRKAAGIPTRSVSEGVTIDMWSLALGDSLAHAAR